jgi:hypothetical protein
MPGAIAHRFSLVQQRSGLEIVRGARRGLSRSNRKRPRAGAYLARVTPVDQAYLATIVCRRRMEPNRNSVESEKISVEGTTENFWGELRAENISDGLMIALASGGV